MAPRFPTIADWLKEGDWIEKRKRRRPPRKLLKWPEKQRASRCCESASCVSNCWTLTSFTVARYSYSCVAGTPKRNKLNPAFFFPKGTSASDLKT